MQGGKSGGDSFEIETARATALWLRFMAVARAVGTRLRLKLSVPYRCVDIGWSGKSGGDSFEIET